MAPRRRAARHHAAALAVALSTAVVATCASGCEGAPEREVPTPAQSAPPAGGEAALPFEHLLADPPAAMVALEQHTAATLAAMDAARQRTLRSLDRRLALAEQSSAAPAVGDEVAPSGQVSPAALVTSPTRPRVVGVHIPIEEHSPHSPSRGGDGAEAWVRIDDQVVTTQVSSVDSPEDGSRATSATEVGTTARLCQPADRTEVTVSARQVLSGNGAEVTVETSGTFVGVGDGSVQVTGLVVELTGSAPGEATRHHRLTVSADGWRPDGRAMLSEQATYTVTQSGPEVPAETFADEVAFAGFLVASALTSALDDARRHTESGGFCVRLLASSPTSTLDVGQSADIDVAVVDARTGEPVEGATVTGIGSGGELTPGSVTAPGVTTFTATGRPDYWALLETRTPRGGDDANVPFNGPGWRFAGASYTATAPGHPGPIDVTTTWSGRVCGDPFTDAWDVEVTISSAVAERTIALRGTAKPLADPPSGVGARLLIAPTPPPAGGGPAFRLWVDEENPETRPSHHRVEVTGLEPIEGACVA